MLKSLIDRFKGLVGGPAAANWRPGKKHEEALALVESGKNVLGRYPLNVQIQTVSACNASCYMCPYPESWQSRNPGRMSDEVYKKIVDDLAQYKIGKFCPYLENEPLLDAKIFERIDYAISKLDMRVLEVATNASVLDRKKLEDAMRVLPKANSHIWVSFHGIDKESYESIMGLDFETARENVLALIEKAQDTKIKIRIRGAGMPRFQGEKMPNWFSKKDYVNFWNNEFAKHKFKVRPEINFFTYHDRAGQIERNEINFSKAGIFRPSLKDFYCVKIDQWINFLYTGELVLCCMDYHRETVFGDIKDNSINEIFTSDKFLCLAKQVLGSAESPDGFICKKCSSPGG